MGYRSNRGRGSKAAKLTKSFTGLPFYYVEGNEGVLRKGVIILSTADLLAIRIDFGGS